MREKYHTKQKELILDSIRNYHRCFTVKELYNDIKEYVGLTTIYRLVDKLVLEGNLNRYIGNDNITYYEYFEECVCDNHFFLKCNNCGDTIHVDCDCITDLLKHISNYHEFIPDKEKIVINGICQKCQANS